MCVCVCVFVCLFVCFPVGWFAAESPAVFLTAFALALRSVLHWQAKHNDTTLKLLEETKGDIDQLVSFRKDDYWKVRLQREDRDRER